MGGIPGHSSVVICAVLPCIQYVQPLLTGLTDDKQAQAHDQNGPPLDAYTCRPGPHKHNAIAHIYKLFTPGRSFGPLAGGLFVHRVVRGAINGREEAQKLWIIRSFRETFCHATFFMYPHLATYRTRIRNSSNVSQGVPMPTPCGSTTSPRGWGAQGDNQLIPRPNSSSNQTKLATRWSGAERRRQLGEPVSVI